MHCGSPTCRCSPMTCGQRICGICSPKVPSETFESPHNAASLLIKRIPMLLPVERCTAALRDGFHGVESLPAAARGRRQTRRYKRCSTRGTWNGREPSATVFPPLCLAISLVKEISSTVTVPPTRQEPCSDGAMPGPTPEAISKPSWLFVGRRVRKIGRKLRRKTFVSAGRC